MENERVMTRKSRDGEISKTLRKIQRQAATPSLGRRFLRAVKQKKVNADFKESWKDVTRGGKHLLNSRWLLTGGKKGKRTAGEK